MPIHYDTIGDGQNKKSHLLFSHLVRIVLLVFLHFSSGIYLSKISLHHFIGFIWIISPLMKINVSIQETKIIARRSTRKFCLCTDASHKFLVDMLNHAHWLRICVIRVLCYQVLKSKQGSCISLCVIRVFILTVFMLKGSLCTSLIWVYGLQTPCTCIISLVNQPVVLYSDTNSLAKNLNIPTLHVFWLAVAQTWWEKMWKSGTSFQGNVTI